VQLDSFSVSIFTQFKCAKWLICQPGNVTSISIALTWEFVPLGLLIIYPHGFQADFAVPGNHNIFNGIDN